MPAMHCAPPFLRGNTSSVSGVAGEALEQGSGENVLMHNLKSYIYGRKSR